MIGEALDKVTGFIRDSADQIRKGTSHPAPAFRITVDGNDIAKGRSAWVNVRLLRPTSLYGQQGCHQDYIQALLGHADEKMTEHYLAGHGPARWRI